ncbi:hypothetical protein N665_1984s0009 [Sinapis alba]|nr:hypothetical protein N665_1984s0009 [Sinapis alba]
MKSPILFIVSCVVLLLILSYPKEAKAAKAPKTALNRCQAVDYFDGDCGNDGIQRCLQDFKKKNRKNNIVDQCTKCETNNGYVVGNRRLCQCSVFSSSCIKQ